MSFTLTVAGVGAALLAEDGLTELLAEDGTTVLLAEGGDLSAAALLYGSITLKRNTLDFGLFDAGIPALGAAVTTTDPAWSGTVAAVTTSDPVDLRNSHWITTVTATNTNALPADTAPFDLSDVPSAAPPFDYLLEDGSGHYLIESGTDFAPGALMLEGALAYGYSGLSVRKVAGSPPTTLGQCTVRQPGLRPGNVVHVTSLNQGWSAVAYTINQATVTWAQGVNPPAPAYRIEFGDTPQTLALWTQLTAPAALPPVTAPVIVPSGIVIYGNATGVTGLQTVGGGLVTIASNTFSVSVPAGHTLTCQVLGQIDCRAYAWDDYAATPRRAVRASLSGGIYTGAWQETPAGTATTSGARALYSLTSASGLALAAGTYTVKVEIDTQGANQMQVFSSWCQVAVTTV